MKTGTPRRSREKITSVVSRIGSATNAAAATIASVPSGPVPGSRRDHRGDQEPEWHAAAVAEEDARRPREVERRNARAGAGEGDRHRGEQRRPRRAQGPTPRRLARPTAAAAPSTLSMRLNAFTTPTTQTTVSSRLIRLASKRNQPMPAAQRTTAAAISTPTRTSGPRPTRSSTVPTTDSTTAHPTIAAKSDRPPPNMSAGGRKAAISAAPPRYGVARRGPCSRPDGRGSRCARRRGSRSASAIRASASAEPSARISRSSSGKLQLPIETSMTVACDMAVRGVKGSGGSALEGDHVVDRVVDRAGRAPAGEPAQQPGVRLAPAELLEALVVGLVDRARGGCRTSIPSARSRAGQGRESRSRPRNRC